MVCVRSVSLLIDKPQPASTTHDFMKSFVATQNRSVYGQDSEFQYLRRQLGDNMSCTSKSTEFNQGNFYQDQQKMNYLNSTGFKPINSARKSALTKFSDSYRSNVMFTGKQENDFCGT